MLCQVQNGRIPQEDARVRNQHFFIHISPFVCCPVSQALLMAFPASQKTLHQTGISAVQYC